MPDERLTREFVLERLHYDPGSGVFTWRRRPGHDHQTNVWNAKYIGRSAGSVAANGYVDISFLVGNRRIRAAGHRLAWLYVYGVHPSAFIDHIDGDKTNNRIENLREATAAQNAWNTGARSWSKSGVKGVSWDKSRGKWFASIFVNRKQIALGRYDAIEDAARAYEAAALRFHGEFANTSGRDR